MEGGHPQRFPDGRIAYHWGTFYPDLEAWGQVARATAVRLGALTRPVDGPSIRLCYRFQPRRIWNSDGQSRFHWFDPLHPATAERMHALARRYGGTL